MSFLNITSIRTGRKLLPNKFSKKISKKHKSIKKNKKSHHRRQGFQEIYIDGKPVRKPPPSPIEITWIWNTDNVRNWLELPPEITLRIFTKLDTIDVVLTVSQVCSSWRNLSKEPILYRFITIGGYDSLFRGEWMWGFPHIAKKAADRSRGKILQFSCGNMNKFIIHDLHYILDSSSTSLKSLGLGFCCADYIILVEEVQLIKRFPSLERLFFHAMGLQSSDVQDIGFACPKLKYLEIGPFLSDADAKALQIAKSMHGLRRLYLLSNNLTINGFQAILDGCPHLEYMNIKGFYNVNQNDVHRIKSSTLVHRIKSSTLVNQNDEFGEEREFYLETTNVGQHMIEEEEESDYGGLSLYKTSFVDCNDPFFKLYFDF